MLAGVSIEMSYLVDNTKSIWANEAHAAFFTWDANTGGIPGKQAEAAAYPMTVANANVTSSIAQSSSTACDTNKIRVTFTSTVDLYTFCSPQISLTGLSGTNTTTGTLTASLMGMTGIEDKQASWDQAGVLTVRILSSESDIVIPAHTAINFSFTVLNHISAQSSPGTALSLILKDELHSAEIHSSADMRLPANSDQYPLFIAALSITTQSITQTSSNPCSGMCDCHPTYCSTLQHTPGYGDRETSASHMTCFNWLGSCDVPYACLIHLRDMPQSYLNRDVCDITCLILMSGVMNLHAHIFLSAHTFTYILTNTVPTHATLHTHTDNIITVTFELSGLLKTACATSLTLIGLVGAVDTTSSIDLIDPSAEFPNNGTWNRGLGSLAIVLVQDLQGSTLYSIAFHLTNPLRPQNATTVSLQEPVILGTDTDLTGTVIVVDALSFSSASITGSSNESVRA